MAYKQNMTKSGPLLTRFILPLYLPFILPLLLGLLLARPVAGQPVMLPLAGEDPTEGVHLPSSSLISNRDAAGLELNPGAVGLLRSWSLMFHHAEVDRDARINGGGDALFLGTPVPLVRSLVLGVGFQWLRPAHAIGYHDSTKISLGLAWRVSSKLSMGASYHFFATDEDPALDQLGGWDLGLVFRPYEWLGAGLVVKNINTPDYQGLPLQRVYHLELVGRPWATRRLELGVGVQIHERWGTVDPRFRLELEPVSGFQLFGDVEILSRDFYRTGVNETDVRATVGFGFSLEQVGVAISTMIGRSLPTGPGPLSHNETRGGYQGIGATLRLQGQRQDPLVTTGKLIVHLKLRDRLSERKMIKLVQVFRMIEQRSDVVGVLLELDQLGLGWAHAQELRAWLKRLRRAGKRSYAFLRAASDREYYLASAADHVLLDPGGGVRLQGLVLRTMHLRGTFDLLGVSPQFVRIAEYKSAPESYLRKSASEPARRMMSSLLDDLFAHLVRDLAADRKRSAAQIIKLIDQGPFIPPLALSSGLVDELVPSGELHAVVEKIGKGQLVKWESLNRAPRRWPVGPQIAVIVADGDIVQGASQTIPLLGRRLLGDETLAKALARARSTSAIKAVVLRVNSPGGSAVASDKMWREVEKTRKVKPVIVSMANMAASGGYYLACAGDKIFAQPATLTGSIGIFTGKFDISGLMGKLGLSLDIYAKGKRSLMESFHRPYSPEERTFILKRLQYYYRLFLAAVSKGRGMTQDKVHEVARGRVWTGAQAVGKKLVDRQGGLIDAIDEAKQRAGLAHRNVQVVVMPREQKGLLGRAMEMLSVKQESSMPVPAALRQALRGFLPVLLKATPGEPLSRVPYHLEY